VWHGEIGLADCLLRERHDVEIEGSRAPAFRARAPGVVLNALQRHEERARSERCFERNHLIEIGTLNRAAEGLRLLDRAHGKQTGLGKRGQRRARKRQMRVAVAEVRAERDIRDVAHGGLTRAPEIVARRARTSEELALTRREATGIVGACQTRAAMDSLTVHYVARELGERWHGRKILACFADHASRALTLWCDGGAPVSFDLRGRAVRETAGAPAGDLLRGWTILAVEAPIDERRIVVQCERAGKFRGSPSKQGEIEVSFIPNARGARVRDAQRTLVAIGTPAPPVAAPRPVLSDETVRVAVEKGDEAALLHGRWMSPAVCSALLADPSRAVERYQMVVSLPAPRPVRCGEAIFPLPLCDGDPVASLIPAAAAASAATGGIVDRTARALARMRRELERAREAPRLRLVADALMALGADADIPVVILLPDGSEAPVPRTDDPQENPITLAERLYKEVRAMERGLEGLPSRIAALESGVQSGSRGRRPSARRAIPPAEGKRLPYKSYRTSGGIDVLVGRGARANDELTYDIAKPDDVWLHARDVTGAHVVMRWSQDGAPPARDLHEAAALAAWYSRARGSVVVPVDWTRRRHVRRARGGPPGRALVERAQTVMARPTAELERKLRSDRNEE